MVNGKAAKEPKCARLFRHQASQITAAAWCCCSRLYIIDVPSFVIYYLWYGDTEYLVQLYSIPVRKSWGWYRYYYTHTGTRKIGRDPEVILDDDVVCRRISSPVSSHLSVSLHRILFGIEKEEGRFDLWCSIIIGPTSNSFIISNHSSDFFDSTMMLHTNNYHQDRCNTKIALNPFQQQRKQRIFQHCNYVSRGATKIDILIVVTILLFVYASKSVSTCFEIVTRTTSRRRPNHLRFRYRRLFSLEESTSSAEYSYTHWDRMYEEGGK